MAKIWSPIDRPNAVDLARDTIKAAIASGQYGPGELLPNERALAQRLNISRVSLRKALLQLRAEGYLVSERGTSGGSRITSLIQPSSTARRLARRKPERFAELVEFRIGVECETARLAARRATKAQLRVIAQSISAIRDRPSVDEFRRADSAFHLGIASAAANELLARAVLETRSELFLLVGDIGELILDTTLSAHISIADALIARDADAAARAMRAHLVYAAEELLS
ncbi:MAG: FadR/GntR family transcriptional regulator [Candidatus Sulfotelmatobacter sp.]